MHIAFGLSYLKLSDLLVGRSYKVTYRVIKFVLFDFPVWQNIDSDFTCSLSRLTFYACGNELNTNI